MIRVKITTETKPKRWPEPGRARPADFPEERGILIADRQRLLEVRPRFIDEMEGAGRPRLARRRGGAVAEACGIDVRRLAEPAGAAKCGASIGRLTRVAAAARGPR